MAKHKHRHHILNLLLLGHNTIFIFSLRFTGSRPLTGGSLSRPANRFPDIFGQSELLKTYPYLLPCSISTIFVTTSLSILPGHALDPPSASDTRAPAMSWADDGDSESEQPQVVVVTSFAPTPRLPPLDARTQKCLQTLLSPSHLNALLKAAQHDCGALPDLVSWLVDLYTIPGRTILSTLLLYGGGGLVREIYRDYVRNSPLGEDENMSSLMGSSSYLLW
ncbi:hypothetical protein BDR03DRAFT_1034984 [Suillus americanus]|nr:hypothetical protein BDR03DRAFT_1034984 [Suillus americanus]